MPAVTAAENNARCRKRADHWQVAAKLSPIDRHCSLEDQWRKQEFEKKLLAERDIYVDRQKCHGDARDDQANRIRDLETAGRDRDNCSCNYQQNELFDDMRIHKSTVAKCYNRYRIT